jgi:hypothetical protein
MTQPTLVASSALPPRGVRFLLSTLPAPASKLARVGRGGALAIATIGPPAAAIALMSAHGGRPHALAVPAVLLVVSALLAHHGRVGSQLLARSVWWANLCLGVLLSFPGNDRERLVGLVLVIATGAPLLAMGRLGLDGDEESAFRPVAFRTTLALGMMMAVADAQALLLLGALKIEGEAWPRKSLSQTAQGVILLLAAGMILVAIAGLYRLRVWGLLLAALCAVGLIGLAASDVCGLTRPLPQALMASAVVQLLLPAPIVAAIVRGRAPAPRAPSRLARLVPALVVAALVGSSVVTVLRHGWDHW